MNEAIKQQIEQAIAWLDEYDRQVDCVTEHIEEDSADWLITATMEQADRAITKATAIVMPLLNEAEGDEAMLEALADPCARIMMAM